MAIRMVNVDRNTPLLFPPDLRDWVEQDDLVHFVLEAVDALPLRQLRYNQRGTGSEQYPPRMMLTLLIYCYATGTFSSRAIESLTYRHVSVRYICANTHPDHDTICTFRARNKALLEEAFVAVLQLAAELKFSKVGTVAIDGTKVLANASKHSAVSYGRAGEIIERLEGEVQALLLKAEDADSVPLQDGLSIPQEIARREARQRRLREARAAIEARMVEQQAAAQAAYEEKVAERQARRERGEKVRGREPQAPATELDAKAQYNFTDPESRIMKSGNGAHFEQAYNAQAAVSSESMLVVGQHVSDAANDKRQLQPTLESIPACLGQPEQVVVDSGYFNSSQIEAVEGSSAALVNDAGSAYQGDDRDDNDGDGTRGRGSKGRAPVVYAAVERTGHHEPLTAFEAWPDLEAPPPNASTKERMQHRLKTEHGKAVYKLRKQTVEPVFGIIKNVMGFRHFSLRGLEKVSQEWTLVCLAWNMKRLHKLGMRANLVPIA